MLPPGGGVSSLPSSAPPVAPRDPELLLQAPSHPRRVSSLRSGRHSYSVIVAIGTAAGPQHSDTGRQRPALHRQVQEGHLGGDHGNREEREHLRQRREGNQQWMCHTASPPWAAAGPLGTPGDSVGPVSDLSHPRDQEAPRGHCPVGDSVSLKDRNFHNEFTESFHTVVCNKNLGFIFSMFFK